MGCIEAGLNGSPCYGTPFVFDPRRRGMLCRAHALAPLERVYGQRPDLEEKAEMVLRFLALSSEHRHEVLEGLSPSDRREFIDIARLFELDR